MKLASDATDDAPTEDCWRSDDGEKDVEMEVVGVDERTTDTGCFRKRNDYGQEAAVGVDFLVGTTTMKICEVMACVMNFQSVVFVCWKILSRDVTVVAVRSYLIGTGDADLDLTEYPWSRKDGMVTVSNPQSSSCHCCCVCCSHQQ